MLPPTSSTILVAAGLAGLASAAPYPGIPFHKTGGFSIPQVKAERSTFVRHGPSALAKAYLKYGVPLPDNLSKAVTEFRASQLARRSQGSAVNNPTAEDEEYLTEVSIGSPAQKFKLDFDTGSSDLWVFSTETPANEVNGQTQYKTAASTSAKQLNGQSFNISYGDGSSASGNVFSDKVSVGGVPVQGQAVEAAKTVSSTFTQDTASDGLMGLAFSSINTVQPQQQKTFFDNVKSSLDSPLFTADLKHNAPGTYNFGFIDNSSHTGNIAFTDVNNSQGFWMFTASGFSTGNANITNTAIQGIADTGTTLALLPDAALQDYYGQVKSAEVSQQQGGVVFNCNEKLPNFNFAVGSNKISIPGTFINFAPVDQTGQQCFGGLQSSASVGFSIFGDVALKSAFVVFEDNGNQPRIGWATKKL